MNKHTSCVVIMKTIVFKNFIFYCWRWQTGWRTRWVNTVFLKKNTKLPNSFRNFIAISQPEKVS